LQQWQEEKNKPNAIVAPRSEEEEERYWRLMEKEICINDTALALMVGQIDRAIFCPIDVVCCTRNLCT
jgi:hypothetical protein